ncbi:adenylyl cyclase X E isoform X2 [Diabrotica virgifera virgifera]|uniref:adenylate cyclase n=1 Tax=Diabrotica virgifera virgifera TaxID=50390 RepID=A0A6P7F9C7_DIAVI|nr:adenylyl cyclase X E isoform X2 [Diabrotica virgifera virgifera]
MYADDVENVDHVILSRISLKEISTVSDDDPLDRAQRKSIVVNDERKWRLSYLRSQFESYQLQDLFKLYTKKVNHGYFSLYLILQTLLTITHFSFVLSKNVDDPLPVLPDIILYISTILLSLICLYIIDRVAEKYNRLQYATGAAFCLIFFVNGFIPYYYRGHEHFRPAYSPYLIIACYLFFAINNLTMAVMMGVSVSAFHIATLYFVTYSNLDHMIWKKITSDAIFAFFMNCLGVYYRYMNEIVIRRSFLDRRDSIMSTFLLKHEKKQVDHLMQSIIPEYVINKVKERYIETTKHFIKTGHVLQNPFDNSLLDEHENVSILFADIVNYTEMTGTLKITELLDTLNELFGLFDDCSDKRQVTRIKFLGDCYYCVAGLPPDAATNSAEACVDLGLDMIAIIASVRKKRNLNVNMRIGIHSGKILSGIIGTVKYQFDIWSKDVDIANKMESEGRAGMVHITNITKDLLTKKYLIEPTDKGETVPQFKNCGLKTFLIRPNIEKDPLPSPTSESCPSSPTTTPGRPSIFKKQRSYPSNLTLLQQLQRVPSVIEEDSPKTSSVKIFIDDQKYRHSEERMFRKSKIQNQRASDTRRSTNTLKRRTAFMNNNIKRYNERTNDVNEEMGKSINLISFSKYQQYVKVKDINVLLLFNKWKIEMEYLKIPDALFKYYLLSAAALIICVYIIQNLTLKQWDVTTWPFLATAVPIIFIFLPISWAEYLYNKYIASHGDETPNNILLKCIYKMSGVMTNNFAVRLVIFLMIYISFLVCVMGDVMECRDSLEEEINIIDHNGTSFKTSFLNLLIYRDKDIYNLSMLNCVLPWDSETFNHLLDPQVAHIMSTVFLIITLHLVDRQTDYMNRLDYLLNRKFKFEQNEANLLQKVNENLLVNILPKHVANLYLDVSREQKELYFEEHDNVAVMFASIITEDELQQILDEKEFLTLMNAYILKFDVLTNREQYHNIEKIKIAKWTYMVACGLFDRHTPDAERHQTSSSMHTLLCFASDMFKKLNDVNRQYMQNSRLRIGISHGPIAAGVVGSKKPLYDIWGDPVNMASRMDSTGIPDRIQVLEQTAEVIQKLGYKCTERGNIQVKGKHGKLKTFFVDIDENFNLVREDVYSNGISQKA